MGLTIGSLACAGRKKAAGRAVTLALLLWQWIASRSEAASSGWSRALIFLWMALALTLAVLCRLHPRLDALLDAGRRAVLDDGKFYALHRIYVFVATGQWLAGAVHFASLLAEPGRPGGRGRA